MTIQGTYGLPRGDMLNGVMGGSDMITSIPLDLTVVERQPELMSL
jgi:hypothetical protein